MVEIIVRLINRDTKMFWYNTWQIIYWKFMTGAVVDVDWPVSASSADPNDHYRVWLEENIGRQGRDWQWDCVIKDDGVISGIVQLRIVVTRAKKDLVPMMLLMWTK